MRPYLYTVVSTMTGTAVYKASDGGVSTVTSSDIVNTTIGVRSTLFHPDKGFILNGLPLKLKGLSMHQDVGGCGVAVPDAVNAYRVQSLLDMGMCVCCVIVHTHDASCRVYLTLFSLVASKLSDSGSIYHAYDYSKVESKSNLNLPRPCSV